MNFKIESVWVGALGSAASGLAAILALIAASVAATAAWKTYKKQARQLQTLEDDKKKELASQFSMWVQIDEEAAQMVVKYRNASAHPAYDVWFEIEPYEAGLAQGQSLAGVLPPTAEPVTEKVATAVLHSLLSDLVGEQPELDVVAFSMGEYANIVVRFTDAAGHRWERSSRGGLVEVERKELS